MGRGSHQQRSCPPSPPLRAFHSLPSWPKCPHLPDQQLFLQLGPTVPGTPESEGGILLGSLPAAALLPKSLSLHLALVQLSLEGLPRGIWGGNEEALPGTGPPQGATVLSSDTLADPLPLLL